jgi:hypothetical protein
LIVGILSFCFLFVPFFILPTLAGSFRDCKSTDLFFDIQEVGGFFVIKVLVVVKVGVVVGVGEREMLVV